MATESRSDDTGTRDDIGTPIVRDVPDSLPPHVSSLLAATEADLTATIAAIDSGYDELLGEADEQLSAVVTDAHLVMSTTIGVIDSALVAVEIPAHAALDKLLTTTLGEILYEEAELSRAGVYVPFATDEITAILADDTGAEIVCAINGISPPPPPPPPPEPERG